MYMHDVRCDVDLRICEPSEIIIEIKPVLKYHKYNQILEYKYKIY